MCPAERFSLTGHIAELTSGHSQYIGVPGSTVGVIRLHPVGVGRPGNQAKIAVAYGVGCRLSDSGPGSIDQSLDIEA